MGYTALCNLFHILVKIKATQTFIVTIIAFFDAPTAPPGHELIRPIHIPEQTAVEIVFQFESDYEGFHFA